MKKLLLWAVALATGLAAQASISWTSNPPTAISGTEYTISAEASGDYGYTELTIFKNGTIYFAYGYGYGGSAAAGGTSQDYGTQTINYTAEAYYEGWPYWESITHSVDIIQPNTPPTISWSNNPSSVAVGENYYVQVRGHDQDGNLSGVNVYRNGVPYALNGGQNTMEMYSDVNWLSESSPGQIVFTAQAYDNSGAVSYEITHVVNIYVPNVAPSVTWVNNPASAWVNQWFNVQARGNDNNGNLAWIYVWKDDQPFAFNAASGGESYSDNNAAMASAPLPVVFKAMAGDSDGLDSGFIYHTVTINNHAPSNLTLGLTGAVVQWNATYGHYTSWAEQPTTITSTLHDDDGNLYNHTVRYQKVTGTGPVEGNWTILGNEAATNGTDSSKQFSQTTSAPFHSPGRWDINAFGHDGWKSHPGTSLTVWVYGPNNGATFVSQSGPPVTMQPGQTVTVSVTMRNTGDKSWSTDATPHRLGSINDDASWGLTRVPLPVLTPVVDPYGQAGIDTTFSFSITARTTPGPYPFQWRMVEDGNGWFGDSTPLITVNVPNVAPAVVSATGGTIAYGQSFSTTLRATDANADLTNFHLVVASAAFNASANSWEGSSPDGWKWRHFRTNAVSGGDATITVPVQDFNYGTPDPLPVGTYRLTLNAQDGLPNYAYSASNVLATLLVAQATPVGSFGDRNFSGMHTLTAGDLNATFANPYSGSAVPPTGLVTYSVVSAAGPWASPTGGAISAGTVLRAGSYVIRASYSGDANYHTATKDASFTVSLDPNADDDGDGVSNSLEQLLGLNPFDSTDVQVHAFTYDKINQLKRGPGGEYLKDAEGNIKQVRQ